VREATKRYSIAAVIPVHNRVGTVTRALESVLSQTRRPDEIVVVDDGSTDATPAVVRGFGSEVTLIQQPQGGASAARNTGVASSSSDFVAFLDSDDIWVPDHLARMDEAITATSGAAWLYFSDMTFADAYGGGRVWKNAHFSLDDAFELRERDKQWLFTPIQPIMIQASVVSRDAYLSVGGSDPNLPRRGDTHVIFKLGLGGPMCAVAGVAGQWTADDPNSLTQSFSDDHELYMACTVYLYRDLLDRYPDLDPEARRILRRRLANGYFELARKAGLRLPLRAASNLVRTFQNDPAVLTTRIGRGVRRWTRVVVASPPTFSR
jgi:glycosyltransferase involved in cell wall biosynthesis